MLDQDEDRFWEEADDPISHPLKWVGYSFIGTLLILACAGAILFLMQVIVWVL